MSEYERTLSVEAPADAVFQYVSDAANLPGFLPAIPGVDDMPHELSRQDPKARVIEWSAGDYSGSIEVDSGDVTTTFSEITLTLSLGDEPPSDTPTPHDEQVLDAIDKSLTNIRQHVEHAHRTQKANFM